MSDRKEHCETLGMLLADHGVKADMLTGDLSIGKRTALVDRLRAGDVWILVATGQLIGEGVDLPAIEILPLLGTDQDGAEGDTWSKRGTSNPRPSGATLAGFFRKGRAAISLRPSCTIGSSHRT